ncbi:YtxH domain-containing protein [Chloroflexota bacterium]
MTEKDSTSGCGIVLIVGAAIGLAFGFLFAPKSGREIRALLREKVKTADEKAKEAAIMAEKRAEEFINREKSET